MRVESRVARCAFAAAAADINFNATLATHEKALTATKIAKRGWGGERKKERKKQGKGELNGRAGVVKFDGKMPKMPP